MKKTLAVVDNWELTGNSLKRLFEESFPNLEVTVFTSGRDLIAGMKEEKYFDGALVDETVSNDLGGLECVNFGIFLNPKTVFIGHATSPSMEKDFNDVGAKFFIVKESADEVMCSVIKEALDL